MADKGRLTIASYNLHGLNQGISFLECLCNDYDFVFVQEHWLAPFDLDTLAEISAHMVLC